MACRDAPSTPPTPLPTAGDVATTLNSIDQWINAAQPDKGELIARTAVEKHPQIAVFHAELGRILLIKSGAATADTLPERAAELAAEALASFQHAFDLGLEKPVVLRSAGIAAEQSGHLEEAIEWYRRGSPADPSSTLYLALALLRADLPIEASQTLKPLLDATPDDPFLNATWAECFAAQEHYDRAIESIDNAIRFAPNEPAFRVRRAAMLRRSGTPLAAAESLLAMGEAARATFAVTDELSAAFLAANRPADAAASWAFFAKANPGDAAAVVRTIDAYLVADDVANADAWLALLDLLEVEHSERARLAEALNAGAVRRQVEE